MPKPRPSTSSPPASLKGGVTGFSSQPDPSSLAHGLNIETVVNVANHWREYYNPLPALDLQRARALYDFSRRGLNAELQNVYREMEELHPTLFALLERRNAALQEMDVTIKVIEEAKLPPGCTKSMAEAQAEVLQAAYDGIDNMGEAVEWMELAAFRKYSHLEKIFANPGTSDLTISHLEPVEQWHWTRKSHYAEWEYVAAATQSNTGIPINYEQFIIRDCKRHLDRLALIQWIRASLCEKDWDAFIEIYGIPSWIVIMPPNVPKEKEGEYMAAALQIARGGSGALPGGSDAKPATKAEGKDVFRPRLDWLQEQLVLAGTGGLLSMLSMPTGIGSGASDTHADAFAKIGKKSARAISEVFNRQLDSPILDRDFPGVPHLASFWLASEEQVNPTNFVSDVLKLKQAGYVTAPAQIKEKTGYDVTIAPAPAPAAIRDPNAPEPADPSNPTDPFAPAADPDADPAETTNRRVLNRDGGAALPSSADVIAAALPQFARARLADLNPALQRLHGIIELQDPRLVRNALRKLRAELNDPKSDIVQSALKNPAAAKVLADSMTSGLFNGMAQAEAAHPVSNRIVVNGGEGSGRYPKGSGEIRETRVPIHPAAARKLGVEPDKVFADHAALAAKHPELFKDGAEAKAYIEHVATRPTHVLPGNHPDHALVVRRDEENRAFALDVVKKGGKYRVRSAHTLKEDQFQSRLKSAGPDATLGISHVKSRKAATPSRLLDGSRGTPPADIVKLLDRIASVNPQQWP